MISDQWKSGKRIWKSIICYKKRNYQKCQLFHFQISPAHLVLVWLFFGPISYSLFQIGPDHLVPVEPNCETQLLTDQKLSSSIFPCCCSFVRPDRWHLHFSPLYDVLDHTNHTFSESLWLPLSTDPLTTHPSPTQTHKTHQTHQEPT